MSPSRWWQTAPASQRARGLFAAPYRRLLAREALTDVVEGGGAEQVEAERAPRDLLVRFIWWLVIGWWASGIAFAIAWIALVSIIGIPLAIWLINRLPSVLTLRPRSRVWTIGQDAEGRTVISEGGRSQTTWPIRGLWFILVGWWASALWMALAWLLQLTVIGLPLAMLMFNRTPFVASLYRY